MVKKQQCKIYACRSPGCGFLNRRDAEVCSRCGHGVAVLVRSGDSKIYINNQGYQIFEPGGKTWRFRTLDELALGLGHWCDVDIVEGVGNDLLELEAIRRKGCEW